MSTLYSSESSWFQEGVPPPPPAPPPPFFLSSFFLSFFFFLLCHTTSVGQGMQTDTQTPRKGGGDEVL